jgi:hypothetical protein
MYVILLIKFVIFYFQVSPTGQRRRLNYKRTNKPQKTIERYRVVAVESERERVVEIESEREKVVEIEGERETVVEIESERETVVEIESERETVAEKEGKGDCRGRD